MDNFPLITYAKIWAAFSQCVKFVQPLLEHATSVKDPQTVKNINTIRGHSEGINKTGSSGLSGWLKSMDTMISSLNWPDHDLQSALATPRSPVWIGLPSDEAALRQARPHHLQTPPWTDHRRHWIPAYHYSYMRKHWRAPSGLPGMLITKHTTENLHFFPPP